MTDTRDIHQIEYRWHQTRDLSPVASSMSAESTRGWDSRIRAWVRHPSVDEPSESVCYQHLPNDAAALAWRYRDRQVAERAPGPPGRPLVSRVLIGHASLLTPDVAIMLCRTGLPATAGDRPGRGMIGADLPVISADELRATVGDVAAEFDQEAAREKGLAQVVAAALSDPNTPLAVNIRDPQIFRPPADGPQASLLWGLWRIARPVLGAVRRGWSFSTFELPLGDVDPRMLPDIVFRLAQPAQAAAPAAPRKEIKVRPGDPTSVASGTSYAALAELLIAEYEETGGDGLQQVIARCGAEQPLQTRLGAIYDMLSAKWSPISVSSPPAPLVPVTPAEPEVDDAPPYEPPAVPEDVQYAGTDASYADPSAYYPETVQYERYEPDPGYYPPPASSLGPSTRQGMTAPPLHLRDRSQEPPPSHGQQVQASPHSEGAAAADIPVSELLEMLATAPDPGAFQSVVGLLLAHAATQPDSRDRRRARTLMGDNNFYIPVFRHYGFEPRVEELAAVFAMIVIPDLEKKTVRGEVTDWACRGERSVIHALLVAARAAGDDGQAQMRGLLQPVIAALWIGENGMQEEWDFTLGPSAGQDSGHGFFSRFKRG
jgi:hypothetical protein